MPLGYQEQYRKTTNRVLPAQVVEGLALKMAQILLGGYLVSFSWL
jgi:hypothetical protein